MPGTVEDSVPGTNAPAADGAATRVARDDPPPGRRHGAHSARAGAPSSVRHRDGSSQQQPDQRTEHGADGQGRAVMNGAVNDRLPRALGDDGRSGALAGRVGARLRRDGGGDHPAHAGQHAERAASAKGDIAQLEGERAPAAESHAHRAPIGRVGALLDGRLTRVGRSWGLRHRRGAAVMGDTQGKGYSVSRGPRDRRARAVGRPGGRRGI